MTKAKSYFITGDPEEIDNLEVSTLSISGGITISVGSTSAPSISPSGDSNTGIFFPSPDTVCIGEGGTEALRVDSSGRVGINSTIPRSNLDVGGTILAGRNNSSDEGGEISFCKSLDNSSSWSIDVFGTTSTPNLRFIDNTAGLARMSIDGSGRVQMPYQPAFLAYPSTSILRSAGTFTWQFNTAVFNIGSHFNTSTYRFVAPVAGRYLFGANCRHDSANSDFFRTHFLVNGSNGSYQTIGHAIADLGTVWGPRYYSFSVTYLANLNVNDYVEVASYANTDGAWTQQNESQFWGYLV